MGYTNKIKALASHLGCSPSEIEHGGLDAYAFGREEYAVFTDKEADEAARTYILDTLWAFRPEFIAAHALRSMSDAALDAVAKAQESLCEDANDLVKAIIADLDYFVDDAIKSDGRGHFLSSYDGEEHEVKIGKDYLYIYRIN